MPGAAAAVRHAHHVAHSHGHSHAGELHTGHTQSLDRSKSLVTQRSPTLKVDSVAPENAVPVAIRCAGFWKYQRPVAQFYKNTKTEVFVACLIGANFLTSLTANTIDPSGEIHADIWYGFELFYNVAFTIELAINMYAFWLCEFWRSGWNIFDFIVVSIGLLTTFNAPLPGPFKLLRMMRAFRVFRLFKRVKSLRKIMASLVRSLPGMRDAFIILILVISIYSILAVEFWMEYAAGGEFTNELGQRVEYVTERGQDWGFEYYGNFPKAFFTMFEVMTTEAWSENCARPALHVPNQVEATAVAVFFVSFLIVCGIILVNVVVAVLLEKFSGDEMEEEVEDALDDQHQVDAMEATRFPENLDEDHPLRLNQDVLEIKGDLVSMKKDLETILMFLHSQQDCAVSPVEPQFDTARLTPGLMETPHRLPYHLLVGDGAGPAPPDTRPG